MSRISIMVVLVLVSNVLLARKLLPEIERAMSSGAEAKICLKISDDMGFPIADASVCVVFDMTPRPTSVYGKTDTNGVCVIQGKTNGNSISFLVGKNGYYGGEQKISYVPMGAERAVKDGKWQPYGEELTLVLKPIKNPIKLKSVPVKEFLFTSSVCEWVGYDIEKNDFIKPNGSGEIADFEVYLDWDKIYSINDSKQIGFKIRFIEEGAGFYVQPLDQMSKLPTPYFAETNRVFVKEAQFYGRYNGKRLKQRFDESQCWIIRSRCKFDDNGKLKVAHYSVVRFLGVSASPELKVGFCFLGAFNPMPNDTNLEDIEAVETSRQFIRYCEPKKSK